MWSSPYKLTISVFPGSFFGSGSWVAAYWWVMPQTVQITRGTCQSKSLYVNQRALLKCRTYWFARYFVNWLFFGITQQKKKKKRHRSQKLVLRSGHVNRRGNSILLRVGRVNLVFEKLIIAFKFRWKLGKGLQKFFVGLGKVMAWLPNWVKFSK